MAALFGDDDERKQAERVEKAQTKLWTLLVGNVMGVSPVLGSALEGVASVVSDKFYGDGFMSSAVGETVSNMFREYAKIFNELMKLTDDEKDFVASELLVALGKATLETSTLLIGNPAKPILSTLIRGYENNVEHPVVQLRTLDGFHDDMRADPDDDLEWQNMAQINYANDVKRLVEKIDDHKTGVTALKTRLKAEMKREESQRDEDKIKTLQDDIYKLEREATLMLQRSGPDWEPSEEEVKKYGRTIRY